MKDEKVHDPLEAKKHELEVMRFEFEKEKQTLEKLKWATEATRARNETIDRLLAVITYLNRIQDERSVTVDGLTPLTVTEKVRTWNAHEEDIANLSLQALKKEMQIIAGAK